MCDGAKITDKSDKHKSGIVLEETWNRYQEYLSRIKDKYKGPRYIFIEREERNGFAENIRYAMQNLTKTDHVMIYQHDHVINGKIDFAAVVEAMRKFDKEINYISFMNKSYANIVPKLVKEKKIKEFLLEMLGWDPKYNVITNIPELTTAITTHFQGQFGLPLMPLYFWYDKIHIASRRYYLDVIFNLQGNYDPHLGKNQKTVSFVEDTFGHCMMWSIWEKPELLLKYGAYVYWTNQDVIYHNKGRSFITNETRQSKYLVNKNMKTAQKEKQYEMNSEDFAEFEDS